jgi:IS605 OrfB family transposase
MRRACKVTLKFATARKRQAIRTLLQAYRAAVNFYIRSLWEARGKLEKETLARLPAAQTRLSARYKSQALKQALETVISTKKAAKELAMPCSRPWFRGSAVLDAKFVSVEEGRGTFNLVVRLSTLVRGRKITIPTRSTAVIDKWLAYPNAKLAQGCTLSEDSLVLWVETPNLPEKTEGSELGIDIGVHKLLSLSSGEHLGTAFKQLRDKIRRKQSRSKAKGRALRERDRYIRETINQLPWNEIKLLAVEELKNLKKGKSKKRNKNFRKAMAPWSYRQVIEAVKQKAQQHRVHVVSVPPAYTSQTCPCCGTVSKRNRKGEDFDCIHCKYHNDADTVGAINVLSKALQLVGSAASPAPTKDPTICLTI